jgi:hypothetical protein
MHCAICGQECNNAFLRLGGYCCEKHRQEVLKRHRDLVEELAGEDVRQMPDVFHLPDFERFALKLAVHLLLGMSEGLRQLYRQRAPNLLDPLEMALELKECILRQLPASHVHLEDATGLAVLFHDGTYRFLQPVPDHLVVEAIRKARLCALLGEIPDEEGPHNGNGKHSGPAEEEK